MTHDWRQFTRGMRRDPHGALLRDEQEGRLVRPAFGASPLGIRATTTVDRVLGDFLTAWPVRDQKRTLYCTRYSLCAAAEHAEWLEFGRALGYFSPHFVAYVDVADTPHERGQNLGQAISISARYAHEYGFASDEEFPAEIPGQLPEQRVRLVPPREAFIEAERHQVLADYRIGDGDVPAIFRAHERGLGVQYGILLREGAYSRMGSDGLMWNVGDPVGWHAMYGLGIVEINGELYEITRNSYGEDFGLHGWVLVRLSDMAYARDLRVYTSQEMPTRRAA